MPQKLKINSYATFLFLSETMRIPDFFFDKITSRWRFLSVLGTLRNEVGDANGKEQ